MSTPSFIDSEHRNRLPTLLEVLGRRTLAPVDLFSFYIYMRDQQCSVDYLDFWLDVSQHMSLCRHYVRELRRSVLLETPEPEKMESRPSTGSQQHRRGRNCIEGGTSGKEEPEDSDQRLSAFLRSEGHTSAHSMRSSFESGQSGRRGSVTGRPRRITTNFPPLPQGNGNGNGNDSSSPGHTVARSDIRASAVRILYTYLLPGSEREVVLPDSIVGEIVHMIEEEGRDDPEVFDTAKDYVFQAMERDAFPGFLQAKALGNLVPPSILARLVIALASFGGGFWAAFYLILTDAPRSSRLWVILPFAIAAYFLSSYQYKIDPIMALLGLSEYTFMNWTRIREPYVRSLLVKRASVSLILAVVIAVAICLLFILVPGTRL
ncbi:Bud site selection protein, Revert to axial protein 1 [Myotisia sp. PD_48]|nr:Bud site selection protein, Revert to axial protein 1 [Myotisia sp. PD_48]